MCKERLATLATNAEVDICAKVAQQGHLTMHALLTLYHCLEKLNAKPVQLASGVPWVREPNSIVLKVSTAMALTLTHPSVLRERMEQPKI